MGVDSSQSIINTTKTLDYGGVATDSRVVDYRHLEDAEVMNGNWDKHLQYGIPLDLERPIYPYLHIGEYLQSMNPGSTFFFEMGGHGNAPEMVTAFMFALVNQGVPIETTEAICPWLYLSYIYMKAILKSVGFQVKMIELNPQPLELTTSDKGGLEGFMRLIDAQMLDILDTEEEKDNAMEQICRMLGYGTAREDGRQGITYASLKCVAVKP